MGYLELVSIVVFMVSRLRLRDLQAELRTVEFENEIRKQTDESPILLFLKHQAELKRYYDQALQQSGLAFILGIFCTGRPSTRARTDRRFAVVAKLMPLTYRLHKDIPLSNYEPVRGVSGA